ncbi:MAG TPA: glycosyltransferase [Deltaproteobacteria bacterium]|nr:glycosyltransferase [Deltaproteobacteria bacterium]
MRYTEARKRHWDAIAVRKDSWRSRGEPYHRRLEAVYRHIVSPNLRVLEIGCGTGELLAALEPSFGMGVDFSSEMIERAKRRHPHLHFLCADAHALPIEETFDVIVLSDLVNDLWDVQAVLENLARLSHPRTRVVINTYSLLWEIPLAAVRMLGLATPVLRQNWLTVHDLTNMLNLAGFEVIRRFQEVLWPFEEHGPLARFLNRVLVKVKPFSHLALTNVIVARPKGRPMEAEPVVSVVVPARNEAGNIEAIFERVPEMGAGTQIVFVEGNSTDDTYAAIERAIEAHPERRAVLFRQKGKGKGDAVRLGFEKASGDVLMILDADLTVPPEDLPRFYEAVRSGEGEFINGVRLVYPMEKQAMRYLNMVGNKFFSLAFTWLLGQPIKDTLCGTKVLTRSDYARIAANRNYFGDFDPFGDFDLLFGAAKQNLKIVEIPVRYRERTYGTTNIDRWRHGLLLLRMTLFAMRRIKFF